MTDKKRNNEQQQENDSRTTTRAIRTRSPRIEHRRRSTESEQSEPRKQFWVQIRLLPIWLRILLVILLLTGAAIFGAIIGYGYIGDGEPTDVLKKETWTHILDIINGKE
jgi:hypothetical protein